MGSFTECLAWVQAHVQKLKMKGRPHQGVIIPFKQDDPFQVFTFTFYTLWWFTTVVTTYFSLFFIPFDIAFSRAPGAGPRPLPCR